MASEKAVRRRQYSEELKAQVIAECDAAGLGIRVEPNSSSTCTSHSLIGGIVIQANFNLLRLSVDMVARSLYASFEWVDDLEAKTKAFRPAAKVDDEQDRTIRSRIVGEEKRIRFTEPHILRLKALWSAV